MPGERHRPQQRERHADRGEAVVHEHPAAGRHLGAPADDVVERGAVAVRAVDEEHVRRRRGPRRAPRSSARARARPARPRRRAAGWRGRPRSRRRRAPRRRRSPAGRGRSPGAGRCRPPARRRTPGRRRAAAEGADLDHLPALRHGERGAGRAGGPAPRSASPRSAWRGSRRRGSSCGDIIAARGRARSPIASTAAATTSWAPSTSVAKPVIESPLNSSGISIAATAPSTHRNRTEPSASMYCTVR